METLLRLAVLAAIFGAGGWAGWALSRPEAEPVSAPPAPPAKPVVLGDLDGRAPTPVKPAPKPPAPDAPIRITFADISQWDLDPKDVQVPASVMALSGKDVDIVGYVLPYGNSEAFEEFSLVRDLGSCCFGAVPQPHHMLEGRFVGGKRFAYVPGPMRVRGRFRVEEHRQGRILVSVFAIDATDCVEVR